MKVEELQQLFRKAQHHVPSDSTAQSILDALPAAALATGWTEMEVLDVVIANAPGAVTRLLEMNRNIKKNHRRGRMMIQGVTVTVGGNGRANKSN